MNEATLHALEHCRSVRPLMSYSIARHIPLRNKHTILSTIKQKASTLKVTALIFRRLRKCVHELMVSDILVAYSIAVQNTTDIRSVSSKEIGKEHGQNFILSNLRVDKFLGRLSEGFEYAGQG